MKRIGLVLALMLLAGEARADKRFALVVGVNHGKPGLQQELRYAEDDARRVAGILGSVGRFHPANIIVLTDSTAEAMRDALADLDRRMAQTEDALLLVFYSGHADGTALNLGTTRYPLDELRENVINSSAVARILVIDACRSGVLTRVKGGWPGPAFEVPDDQPIDAEGIAILASSAAGEEAQESEQLAGSFFTHYFASGLLGAADKNGDLEVTLGETFAYAAERTLAATNATFVGPQHPTYRVELRGRDDLVLTSLMRMQDGVGSLQFAEAGGYLIQEAQGEHRTIAEVALAGGQTRRLAVGSGRYRVTRRAEDHLLAGEFEVRPSAITEVREDAMSKIAYARMVRKGDVAIDSAVSMLALGGVRSSLPNVGLGWRVGVGARVDLEQLSLEARVEMGGASITNDASTHVGTREVSVSVAGLRAFDVGPLTLGVGLELGGVWFNQRFDVDAKVRNSFGGLGGPIAMIELPIERFSVRLEAGVPVYLVRTEADRGTSSIEAHLIFRAGLGFGLYF